MKKKSQKSKAEETLNYELKSYRIDFVREHRFHPTRRWRFDFAIPDLMLAIEVEGVTSYGQNKDGSMKLGRHQNAKGYTEDCIKYGEAMMLGWTVYRCTPALVSDRRAIETILKLIELRQASIKDC